MELAALVYAGALIFARLGAIFMLMPGIGEPGVPPRARLAFALMFSLALAPFIAPELPAEPVQPLAMAAMLMSEAVIGLMIGAVMRMFMSVASVAGQIVGQQTGLAMAQAFDPSQGQSGALMSTFLNLLFIVLIFVTNLHHLLLLAARGSYEVMPVGALPPLADMAEWALTVFSDSFRIGIQISAPLIVFGLVFYFGLGVLSRLMPQAQIFFIAMPVNILAGFFIFAIAVGAMAMVWLQRLETFAVEFQ